MGCLGADLADCLASPPSRGKPDGITTQQRGAFVVAALQVDNEISCSILESFDVDKASAYREQFSVQQTQVILAGNSGVRLTVQGSFPSSDRKHVKFGIMVKLHCQPAHLASLYGTRVMLIVQHA